MNRSTFCIVSLSPTLFLPHPFLHPSLLPTSSFSLFLPSASLSFSPAPSPSLTFIYPSYLRQLSIPSLSPISLIMSFSSLLSDIATLLCSYMNILLENIHAYLGISVYLAVHISAYFIYVSVFWYFSVHSSIKRNQHWVDFGSFDCFRYLGYISFRLFSVVFEVFRYSVGPSFSKKFWF